VRRFHFHQHAPHIGVMNNRFGHTGFVAGRNALHALACIGQCMLVRTFCQRHAFEADIQARMVHHGEHVAQALVRLADQIAGRPAFFAIGP